MASLARASCPSVPRALKRLSARLSGSAAALRVGGVPEHFNTPWHTAALAGRFEQAGVPIEWTDFPGGTGAMAKALREGELDVAILLTEGIVADIHKGSHARLLGTYVSSPLTWGIHVAASSPLTEAASLYSHSAPDGVKAPRFAVSRMSSGSHLMAFVDARRRAGDAAAAALQFEIVGDLEGARACLREGRADAFMWEKFTTKPLVDSGEWRRIGECMTEWSCFSLAATPQTIATLSPQLHTALDIVAAEAARLRASADAVEVIGEMYKLQPVDVTEWLKTVEWECSPRVSFSMLRHVVDTLAGVGVLHRDCLLAPEQLVAQDFVKNADED